MSRVILRIRELREALGLTQVELAELADVRRATISSHETGEAKGVDFEVLDRIARALNTEPGFLVIRVQGDSSAPSTPPRRGRPPGLNQSKRR